MREEVLPKEIPQALVDFKAGEMATSLKRAVEEGIEKFKADKLPNMLQREFNHDVKTFPYSVDGEAYIYREWGMTLVEYRDMVLHYYPNLNVKVVDRHFLKIFDYAKVEGEELPIIEVKDVAEASKGDEPKVVEAVPTPIITKVPSQS